MAKINALDNNLDGQSGSGSFLGTEDPIITDADFSLADSLKITNSSSPVISSAGDMAVKTSISNFNGMVNYRDSSSSQLAVGVPFSDLSSAEDGYIVGYNSSSSSMRIIKPSLAYVLKGYATDVSTSDDVTTSNSYVDTSLSVSYTPVSADSILWVTANGQAQVQRQIGASTTRSADYLLRRTAGSAADLYEVTYGRDLVAADSVALKSNFDIKLSFIESAGSTSLHTYIVRHRISAGLEGGTLNLNSSGGTRTAYLTVWEISI